MTIGSGDPGSGDPGQIASQQIKMGSPILSSHAVEISTYRAPRPLSSR